MPKIKIFASRVYVQKYSQRKHSEKLSFENLLQTLRKTGTAVYKKVVRQKTVTGNEENEFPIIGSLLENPYTSHHILNK